jgi:hypothetical protein
MSRLENVEVVASPICVAYILCVYRMSFVEIYAVLSYVWGHLYPFLSSVFPYKFDNPEPALQSCGDSVSL